MIFGICSNCSRSFAAKVRLIRTVRPKSVANGKSGRQVEELKTRRTSRPGGYNISTTIAWQPFVYMYLEDGRLVLRNPIGTCTHN